MKVIFFCLIGVFCLLILSFIIRTILFRLNADSFKGSFPLITELYIGTPGAGKTTIAAWYAKKYIKRGITVWSNVPIKGCRVINPKEDLGTYDVSNGVVILDEIGLAFNNRQFKTNFQNAAILEWLKLHRHNFCKVMCFSQGLDFDNRFIGLSQRVYIVSKPFFFSKKITKVRLIHRHIGVDEEAKTLVDEYIYEPFILNRVKYFYMPSVWDMFDSWDAPKLPTKEWQIY